MFQIAIGMGTDELAPEVFIGVDFRVDYGGGDRRFRFDGQRVSTLMKISGANSSVPMPIVT